MALESRFGPGEISFVRCKPSLGLGQIGIVLINNGLIRLGVDFRAELARLHSRASAAIERLDHARYASANRHGGRSTDDAGRSAGADHGTVVELLRDGIR